MNLSEIVSHSRETMHRHGPWAATRLITMAAVRRLAVYERVHVYALHTPPAIANDPSRTTRLATTEDLRPLLGDPAWQLEELDVATVERLLAAGHRCVINLVDGAIAGYGWLNPHRLVVPKLRAALSLRPGEVHIYKDFTHPSHRGLRLGVDRYAHWLVETDAPRTLVTDFAFDNDATMARVSHLGLELVGIGTFIGLGNHEHRHFSPELAARTLTPIPPDLPQGGLELDPSALGLSPLGPSLAH
jgi:hypothetical protein